MTSGAGGRVRITTVKVPQPLRQRIAAGAAEQGETAAAFLARLLDRYERDRRFKQVRVAYSGYDRTVDTEYTRLTQEWDAATEVDLDVSGTEHE